MNYFYKDTMNYLLVVHATVLIARERDDNKNMSLLCVFSIIQRVEHNRYYSGILLKRTPYKADSSIRRTVALGTDGL